MVVASSSGSRCTAVVNRHASGITLVRRACWRVRNRAASACTARSCVCSGCAAALREGGEALRSHDL
jgi:hypothetical protein